MPMPRLRFRDPRTIPFDRLMRGFGLYTIALGLLLFFPVTLDVLRIARPSHTAWTELSGFLVMFTGGVVLWCSRQVRARAALLYWKGLLSVAVGLHLVWFGFFEYMGAMLGVFGLADLALGVIILTRLPREAHAQPLQLLQDRL